MSKPVTGLDRDLRRARAFTLVEMLVVVGVIGILLVLIVPALNRVGSGNAERAFYDIAGYVETAHAYATANNTYVYLGITEYDASRPAGGTQTAGVGRVRIALVACKDGTRGYADTSAANAATSWQSSYAAGANLVVVSKPATYENIHLVSLGDPPATGAMVRPNPGDDAWRVGSDVFKASTQTPFSLPLGSALNAGQDNFNQIVIFMPNGSICLQTSYSNLGQVSPLWLEIGIRPTIGNQLAGSATTNNYAAISINGTTGASRMYRP